MTLTEFRERLGGKVALPADDLDDDLLNDDAEAAARTNPLLPDTDGDRVFDGAEVRYGIAPTDANSNIFDFRRSIGLVGIDLDGCPGGCPGPDRGDPGVDRGDDDRDGLPNFRDTTPNDPDRDGDGLNDGLEAGGGYPGALSLDLDPGGCIAAIGNLYSSPDRSDTDNDTLSDSEEMFHWASDPGRVDTDHDHIVDRDEVRYYTNTRAPNGLPPGVIAIPTGTPPPNC